MIIKYNHSIIRYAQMMAQDLHAHRSLKSLFSSNTVKRVEAASDLYYANSVSLFLHMLHILSLNGLMISPSIN